MTRLYRRAALALGLTLAAAGCSSGNPGPSASPSPSTSPTGASATAGWSSVAKGPLPGRNGATTVWTGSEVLVFGGDKSYCPPRVTCESIPGPARSDGAAYDPAKDAWRLIAPVPVPVRAASAVLVDRTVYVLAQRDVAKRTYPFLSYDIDADRWKELPDPDAVGARRSLATVGDLLVSYREYPGANTHDQYWDAGAARWRNLPDSPDDPGDLRTIVEVDGSGILVGQGTVKGKPFDGLTALRLDPEARTWTPLTSPKTESRPDLDAAPWYSVDGLAVNVSYRSGRQREKGVLGGFLHPEDGWSPLPPWPRKLDEAEDELAWAQAAGDGYVVAGRFALHVPSRTWQEIPVPPELSELGGHPAVAWADGGMFVWGGQQTSDTELDRAWIWRPSPR